MKYAFLVSIAVFAFLISCGKKDKKIGQAGTTTGQEKLDISGEKSKTEGCVDVAECDVGQDEDVLETIPNSSDKNLEDNSKMSILLNGDTSLVANGLINAENSDLVASKFICGDLKDPNDVKESNVVNPDKLTSLTSIILFNDSSIVVGLNLKTGDKAEKPKTYMLSCNSGSSVKASDYVDVDGNAKTKEIEVKQLIDGEQSFELITKGPSSDVGLLTSVECVNDNDILKNSVKSRGTKIANRIRLRIGSAILVQRAIDAKVSESKIKDLGTDAQKEVKFTVISCND